MTFDRVMWIVIIGLAAGIGVLVFGHDNGKIAGMDPDDFASLLSRFALALVIGAGVVTVFAGRLGEALRALAFWVIIFAVLAVGYTYRYELHAVAFRVLAEVAPGYAVPVAGDGPAVEVARGRDGDFNVRVDINGTKIPMLLDTGASSVVLTPEAARDIGLPVDFLKYDVPIDTANGRTMAASVSLDRIAIAEISERHVPALVAPPGALRVSLLGMSFLSRLESFEMRGAKLVMRAKAVD